jgi:hypothetical protein
MVPLSAICQRGKMEKETEANSTDDITPEMIEAGERALVIFDIDFESHREAAIRVYREMKKARVARRLSRGKRTSAQGNPGCP